MYTGIVQGTFPVVFLEKKSGMKSFDVSLPSELTKGLVPGVSVSIDGVCLTAVSIHDGLVRFDAMDETLRLTTIGHLEEGDRVNVERSARMGDEIGGHPMSGHVSTIAEIISVDATENNKAITFQVDPEWMRFIFSKGFIGLDGASLTVVDADRESGTFQVWLIPETLRLTRFGEKDVGDFVNLEIDSNTQTIVETITRILPAMMQEIS